MENSPALEPATDPYAEHLPLRGREYVLIAAFWTLLAVVTIANRLLDPRGGGPQLTISSAPVALAFVSSLLWMIVTPALFWLASRSGGEGSARVARAGRIALLVVATIAAALLVGFTIDAVRDALFSPPPGRGRRGPPGGLRFWFLNDVLVATGVTAAGLARAYSLRYRARREQAARLQAQLAEARLDALRRQLDPHFLFNTLHAISSLVERDPRGVRRMISRLSDLLRHSIEGSGEQEVPLRRELELLGRYVEIMQVRFQGRLEVGMRVDDSVLDALVPNLVLQPLVENAIRHGVGEATGAGRIEIAAVAEGGDVVLRVRDDGAGGNGAPRSTEQGGAAHGSAERGTGVGIRNTVERLEQLYGPGRRFELRRLADGGTEAEVRVPFHTRAVVRAGVGAP